MNKRKRPFWCKESIHWFINAAEFQPFYRHLGEVIAPLVQHQQSIVDLGCGLGYLSMELAHYVKGITAIDEDERVLHHLKEKMMKNNIDNIELRQEDWQQVVAQNNCWDVLLVSYFGRIINDYDQFAQLCRERMIIIGNEDDCRQFAVEKNAKSRKQTTKEVTSFLQRRGIPFSHHHIQLEFGQPFHSIDEAKAFLKWYNPNSDNEAIASYLDQQLCRLEQAEQPYSYYLSGTKNMGIIVIDQMNKERKS